MIKKITIFLFLLFFPFFSFAEKLIITEVQVRGDALNESYIKIYNESEETIDVSGFKIIKKSSTGKEYSIKTLPKNTTIKPKNYLVWANSKNNYHLFINTDIYSTATISPNNSVALFSKDNQLIDALGWGNGENQFFLEKIFPINPNEKEILKRKQTNFYQNTKNNHNDFFVYTESQEKKELSHLNYFENIDFLKQDKKVPIKECFSMGFIFSFLFLIFKKNYGRS